MITSSIGLVVYLATILLAGNVAVSLIFWNQFRPWPERVGLTVALGAGLVAMLLFWVSLAGFALDRLVVLSLLGVFAAAKAVVMWRVPKFFVTSPAAPGFSAIEIGALIAIGACILATLLNSLGLPVYEWDSFAIWALKAKVVALAPLNPRPDYFQDVSLSYSHLDYPLLVPFLTAGVYGAMGGVNDQIGKIIFPVLYAALAFQFFSALKPKLARRESLVLTALGMSIPALVRWSGAGVADVVLVLYYTGAIVYLLKWHEGKRTADLALSILFGLFAAFTKNEGFALVLLIGCVTLLAGLIQRTWGKLPGVVSFVGGVAALHAPWLWWSRTIPRTHENYAGRLRFSIIMENSDRLGVILTDFARQLWMLPRWGGLWLLLFLAAALGWRGFGNRPVVVLWFILLGQLALYIVVLMITPWDLRELLDVALDRLVLQTTPLAVLLIGFHWREASADAASGYLSH